MASRSALLLLILSLIVILSLQTHSSNALIATADTADADDDIDPLDAGDDIDPLDADDDLSFDEEDDDFDLDDEDDDFAGEEDDDEPPVEDEPEPEPGKPATIDPEGEEGASGYTAPSGTGATFFDHFQSGLSKWTATKEANYGGEFKVGQGADPIFKGDRALIIPVKANHYGLSAKIDSMTDLSATDVVLQYEVKLEQGMTCGGAYMKLPTGEFDPESFKGDTPYSIMFGPDKCGPTDKVHFIFQSKNPVTGAMVEHHLKDPPSVANTYDKKTHLYTLIVKKGGKFELLIDNEMKKDGSLADDFEPPVQPEKEIDDPEDKKPDDWVNDAKIPDPEATKPDDWDEDAPKKIPDMDAEKPEGWLDDEPEQIPDPEASKPEEWDDEEDGEWEAPLIPNPKCEEVGCGEWKRPMKKNPDYKGKWKAPKIDNPDYIGVWSPRKIPNPEYYEVPNPTLLPINGIGFEIWTMDQGVLFDNVWLGKDVAAAKKFAAETFSEKQKAELAKEEEANKKKEKDEKEKSPKSGSDSKFAPVLEKIEDTIDFIEAKLEPVQDWLIEKGAEPYIDMMIDYGVQKPMLVVASMPLLVVLLLIIVLGGGKKEPAPEPTASEAAAVKKKTDEPTPDAPDDTVENVDDSAAADAEPEKPSVRRRRTATPE
eukprot:GFKZ01012180.1.p1 GENE.GFKZ01012180.1~~GFKZ01012180.1.p1  ORF type:complete len:759 (-),score=173.70 GFKZ01012180.1:388-2346(-)